MAKRKYKAYHHLPVGTIIVDRNEMFGDRTITHHINGGYMWIYKNGETKSYNFHDFHHYVLEFAKEIIIPHGYQTPLWKVLNDEEI